MTTQEIDEIIAATAKKAEAITALLMQRASVNKRLELLGHSDELPHPMPKKAKRGRPVGSKTRKKQPDTVGQYYAVQGLGPVIDYEMERALDGEGI